MATIVHKLRQHITNEVPKIFDAVFECTLDMINKNFEDFPQHRLSFYELLQAVNAHCFKAFLNIPPAQFKLVFDSVVWAFKHTMRNVVITQAAAEEKKKKHKPPHTSVTTTTTKEEEEEEKGRRKNNKTKI